MKPYICIPALTALALSSAQAAVTLTDLGLTTPSGFTTGHVGSTNQRFSFDAPELPATPAYTDAYGQSFTVAANGTLKYIYMAYNAGGLGSFRISIDTNFTGNQNSMSEVLTDAAAAGTQYTINIADYLAGGLSGQTTAPADTNSSPFYWFRLDFTGENIALTANQTAAFAFQAYSESTGDDSTYVYAPRFQESNVYAGGLAITGSGFTANGAANAGTADFGFAITIPEPSAALLGSLGLLGLLRRRRA